MKTWQKMIKTGKRLLGEEGSFPFLAIIMVVMLIYAGLAFMRWGADESFEAKRAQRKLQAYYVAHAGVFNKGFQHMEDLNPSTILPGSVPLGEDIITDANNQVVGTADVWIRPITLNTGGVGGFYDFNYVDVGATGKVEYKDSEGEEVAVRDDMVVTIKLLSLSQFLYLTNYETTVFGEVIKFWGADTLDGWVHSNDTISMMGGGGGPGPVFYNHVSTTAPIINVISGQPQYLGGPPWLNYREISLPSMATEVRNAASAMGLFFDDYNGQYASRLVFDGDLGWRLSQWPMGQPFMDSVVATGPPPVWQAIFVDGYLELKGIVKGQVTVGAKGNNNPLYLGKNCIRLIDDVRYWMADSISGLFNDTTGNFTDILGIVSEGDIVVGNTWENGRDNGRNVSTPTNMSRHSIIINGAMVALGESFTFEDQNDNYIWEYSTGYIGTNVDNRGDIRIAGSVTQYRRGYVHRNNHGAQNNNNGGPPGDTGYGKHYHFDPRLNTMAPPYFIQATDEEGHAHFEIVAWNHWENKNP